MSDWQRSRILVSGAAALLAMGLAFSSGFAASAAPSAKAGSGQGNSDVRNTGPDFNKGKKLPTYIDDEAAAEELYEDSLAFATEYTIDESKLGMRLKKADTLLEPLKRKAADDRKKLA